VADPCAYDYSVIRVVPDVARGEFLNAGVVLFAKTQRTLLARIALDEERLLALAPEADVAAIRSHLESIARICEGGEAAGPHATLSASERFHWLTAPRSTVIQLSPVHSGICDDPASEADRLFSRLVGD
jgi:Protein of unknown function (DUF3037)